MICMCNDITENEIINAIKYKNCDTVEKVGYETGAGTVCGGCKSIIEGIIEENK